MRFSPGFLHHTAPAVPVGTAVGAFGGQDGGSGIQFNFTAANAIPAGSNIIVVAGSTNNSGTPPVITDSAGNTYVSDVSRANGFSTTCIVIYTCINCLALPAGGWINLAKNTTATTPPLGGLIWTVTKIKRPLDASATATNTSFATSSSVTASSLNGNDMWVGAICLNGSGAPAQPGGWVNAQSVDMSGVGQKFMAGELKLATGETSETYNCTFASAAYTTALAAYPQA